MGAFLFMLLVLVLHAGAWPDLGQSKQSAQKCVRCCSPAGPPAAIPAPSNRMSNYPSWVMPRLQPTIDITILKGEKGESGEKGQSGVSGKEGIPGQRGYRGRKGQKGQIGLPGNSCKHVYEAFSVGRKKVLHSSDYFQDVTFDTEFVNLYKHFNMFTGRFSCYVAGIYFFNLNVHTWNFKETYLHLMRNDQEAAILYTQPSDRSIMQSQSLMLDLEEGDEVWVRMFKRERENAIYSEESDIYITFNGHLIKPAED